MQPVGVMVAASPWRPRPPSSEGTNATDQKSTAPAARTLGSVRLMVKKSTCDRPFSNLLQLKACFLKQILSQQNSITICSKKMQHCSFLSQPGLLATVKNFHTNFVSLFLTYRLRWDSVPMRHCCVEFQNHMTR